MPVSTILVLVALAASVLMFFRGGSRLGSLIALVASGVEAAVAFNVLSLSLKGLPIPLIIGGALAGGAVVTWLASDDKLIITAAAVVMTIGGMQVLAAL